MRKTIIAGTAVAASLALAGTAQADIATTTFEGEGFTPGISVNNQGGWKSTGTMYDQTVVENGASVPEEFGTKSFRLSNAKMTTTFSDQTYSAPTTDKAGENLANKVFIGEFTFLTTKPNVYQPGLKLSVSPDSGEGSRMSYVKLTDTPAGIDVAFSDTPYGYVNPAHHLEFNTRTIATGLHRSVPHTIRFEMKMVAGQDNDVVRVYIDGQSKVCGESWENYYRYDSEQLGNKNVVPAIGQMQFRSGGDGTADVLGEGFLFDNVRSTTQVGGVEDCPLPVGPTDPAGEDGKNGTNGTNVVNGVNGITTIIHDHDYGTLIGNTIRTLHVQKLKGMTFISARATLRNKSNRTIKGRTIKVDLRGKQVGNYNVYVVAKFRTKSGKMRTVRSMRALSITRAEHDASR